MTTSSMTPRTMVLLAAFLTVATAGHTYFGARNGSSFAQVAPMHNAAANPDCARLREILQQRATLSAEEQQAMMSELHQLQQNCMAARVEQTQEGMGTMPAGMNPMMQQGMPAAPSMPGMQNTLGMDGIHAMPDMQGMPTGMPGTEQINVGMPYGINTMPAMQGMPGMPGATSDGMPGFPIDDAGIPGSFPGMNAAPPPMDMGTMPNTPWGTTPNMGGTMPSGMDMQAMPTTPSMPMWNNTQQDMSGMQNAAPSFSMDIEQVRMEERQRAQQAIQEITARAAEVMSQLHQQNVQLQQRVAELEAKVGGHTAAPAQANAGSMDEEQEASATCGFFGRFMHGVSFGMLGC